MESKSDWSDEKVEEIVRWLAIAIEDRRSAYAVFQDGLLKNMVYNLQQASEKLLKAFLIAHDKKIENTHNIDGLMLSAVVFNYELASLKEVGAGASRMTEFATQYRYPNMSKKDFIEPSEAIAAAEFADSLYAHLAPFFGEEILRMALNHADIKENPFNFNESNTLACVEDNRISKPKY